MDGQYSPKQIKGALSACSALIVGAASRTEKQHWQRMEQHWRKRLKEIQEKVNEVR